MSYQVSKIFFPAQQGYGRTCLLHTFQGQAKKTLEQFWLQLAEGSSRTSNFPFTEWPFSDLGRSPTTTPMEHSVVTHISQVKSLISFYTSAMHGTIGFLCQGGDLNIYLRIQSPLNPTNGHAYMIT